MGTMLKKVHSGDPLVIPAATYNTFIDAAREHAERQRSTTRDGLPDWRQTGIVLVCNDSGADRGRFDVLGVSGTVIKPTDNADAFRERIALKGVVPTAAHTGRFVILLEPVKSGLFGRGCVDGACVARVKMLDEGHTFAETIANDATVLQSGASGSAALLWIQPSGERDPDPTIAWVVAKMGLPAGGSMSASFAMITSKAGSLPPYRYAAVAATMDQDGTWTQVGGGTAYNSVFNLEEQGAGGQWVNPLVTGDVVLIFAAPGGADAYVCTRSHYRGTY